MLRFIIDETNRHVGDDGFFIVGGLIFSDEQAISVHKGIADIRTRYGFGPRDQLKFQTSSRPQDMSPETQTLAKKAVIDLLSQHKINMITYLGINAIIKSKNEEIRMKWALDAIIFRYLHYLEMNDAHGEMIMDRDESMIPHLKEAFQGELLFRKTSERLILLGQTSDGLSHLSSAVDIALGGLRYCVNKEASTERDMEVALSIFDPIAKLMWGVQRTDGVRQVGGYGFNLRPKDVRKPAFKERYQSLTARLSELANADTAPTEPVDDDATIANPDTPTF